MLPLDVIVIVAIDSDDIIVALLSFFLGKDWEFEFPAKQQPR